MSHCAIGKYPAGNDCLPCPDFLWNHSIPMFSEDTKVGTLPSLLFHGHGGVKETVLGRSALINLFNMGINIELLEIPDWAQIDGGVLIHDQPKFPLQVNGEQFLVSQYAMFPFEMSVSFLKLPVGNTTGNLSFALYGNTSYPGCRASVNATLQLVAMGAPPDYNDVGPLINLGWSMIGVIFMSCFLSAFWVFKNRQIRLVKVMQPLFLMAVCFGVFLVGIALMLFNFMFLDKFTIDGRTMLCRAQPWFYTMGFTIVFSALSSKLWRINKIFSGSQSYRKVRVTERDVIVPFIIIFTLNVALLLTRTILGTLHFEWKTIDNNPANMIPTCVCGGTTEVVLTLSNYLVTVGAFVLTCVQAYKARNISDEFSETKRLRIALFAWLQIALVVVPVMVPLKEQAPQVSYVLMISTMFSLCMSMILTIFAPMYWQYRIQLKEGRLSGSSSAVRVSGIEGGSNPSQNKTIDAGNAVVADTLLHGSFTECSEGRDHKSHHESNNEDELIALRNELSVLRSTLDDYKRRVECLESTTSAESDL